MCGILDFAFVDGEECFVVYEYSVIRVFRIIFNVEAIANSCQCFFVYLKRVRRIRFAC